MPHVHVFSVIAINNRGVWEKFYSLVMDLFTSTQVVCVQQWDAGGTDGLGVLQERASFSQRPPHVIKKNLKKVAKQAVLCDDGAIRCGLAARVPGHTFFNTAPQKKKGVTSSFPRSIFLEEPVSHYPTHTEWPAPTGRGLATLESNQN